jgi:hypothetical protein
LLTKDPEHRPSIQELIKVPIIREALDLLEFEGKIFFELRNSLIKKDIRIKNDVASLSKIKDLPCSISLID